MGGNLTLTSTVGKGSIFTLTIPATYQKQSTKQVNADQAEHCVLFNVADIAILLVDDVKMNLKVLDAICRKAGCSTVYAASSGTEALDVLAAQKVDVVLTDLWMLEMDGVELCGRIHALKQYEKIPVIAVTADVEAKNNSILDKFSCVLLKPVTIDKIRKNLTEFAKSAGWLG